MKKLFKNMRSMSLASSASCIMFFSLLAIGLSTIYMGGNYLLTANLEWRKALSYQEIERQVEKWESGLVKAVRSGRFTKLGVWRETPSGVKQMTGSPLAAKLFSEFKEGRMVRGWRFRISDSNLFAIRTISSKKNMSRFILYSGKLEDIFEYFMENAESFFAINDTGQLIFSKHKDIKTVKNAVSHPVTQKFIASPFNSSQFVIGENSNRLGYYIVSRESNLIFLGEQDFTSLQAPIYKIIMQAIIAVLILSILACALIQLPFLNLASPIRELTTAVQRIALGKYHVASVPQGKTELLPLCDAVAELKSRCLDREKKELVSSSVESYTITKNEKSPKNTIQKTDSLSSTNTSLWIQSGQGSLESFMIEGRHDKQVLYIIVKFDQASILEKARLFALKMGDNLQIEDYFRQWYSYCEKELIVCQSVLGLWMDSEKLAYYNDGFPSPIFINSEQVLSELSEQKSVQKADWLGNGSLIVLSEDIGKCRLNSNDYFQMDHLVQVVKKNNDKHVKALTDGLLRDINDYPQEGIYALCIKHVA